MKEEAAETRVFTLVQDSSFAAFGAGGQADRASGWELDVKGFQRGDPRRVSVEGSQVVLRWGEVTERIRLIHPISLAGYPAGRPASLALEIQLGLGETAKDSPLQWAAIVRRVGRAWQFEHRFRMKRTTMFEAEHLEAHLTDVLLDPAAELALALQFKPEAREVRLLHVSLESLIKKVTAAPAAPAQKPATTAPNPQTENSNLRRVSGEKIKLKTFKGKVEEASADLVKGWIAPIDPEERWKPEIALFLNGVKFAQIPTFDRADLARNGILNGVGFRLENIPSAKTDIVEAHLIVEQTGEKICSPFDIPGSEMKPRPIAAALSASGMAQSASRGVSIIVPIYNALTSLEACLAALVEHTDISARLILIDDASTDPDIQGLLAKYRNYENIVLLKNEKNLGFTRTVNIGLGIAEGDDVVLLNSDTRVTPRWLQNLRKAAYSGYNVASATAFSDNAGIFSLNIAGLESAGWRDEEIGRLVSQNSGQFLPVSPTAHGFCAYFRGDMLAVIGGLDHEAFPRGYGEENDLSMRANYAGWLNIVDDRTIVLHERSASFGAQKQQLLAEGRDVLDSRYPEYTWRARELARDKRLGLAKFQLQEAITKASSLATRSRKRALYVIASRSGGTPQTNQDLMGAISDHVDTFLLHCNSIVITLSHVVYGKETVLEEHTLEQAIDVRSHRSREYDEIVAGWLDKYHFELVHIRHIAWHSLGLIDVAHALSIPIVFSFHDFYVSCPTVKLLDEKLEYCRGVCTPGDGVCQPELWPKANVPHLKHKWVHNWRKLLLPVLAKCDAYITTIASARAVIRASYPELSHKPFEVIPHGRDFDELVSTPQVMAAGDRFRLLIPGNIGPQKGGDIIADAAELCAGSNIEIHIAGRVSGKLTSATVTFHGQYQRGEFGKIVSAVKPTVGAVLSIWPETYCHTLTELWAAGVPVIGFDIGAVGERIRETGAGWAIPIGTGPEVLEAIKAIAADRADYLEKVRAVQRWQSDTGSHYGTRQMGLRYLALYDSVQASRRAFYPSGQKQSVSSIEVIGNA